MAMRTPDPDDAVLAALHALDDDGNELDHATEVAALDYAEAVSGLAEAVSSPPVLGLRGRLLAAAFSERAPGASIDDGGADDAPVAFARTAGDLHRLLGELDDADWIEPAHPAIGRVRDVVAHLLAIEDYVLSQLPDTDGNATAPRPAPPDGASPRADGATEPEPTHVAYTEPVVSAASSMAVGELRAQWFDTASALASAARSVPSGTTVDLHGLRVEVRGAMFLRTFELWAHLDDIARATGRRRPRLDARRMRAMSTALVEVLPLALAVAGHADVDGRIEVVLTGPGGGTYPVVLGTDGRDAVDCTLTIDVVDLCRLAARRASRDQLDVRVDGDGAIADAVLASVSVFAMD
jgi:uncharacterized protein (TIGR03083 family)